MPDDPIDGVYSTVVEADAIYTDNYYYADGTPIPGAVPETDPIFTASPAFGITSTNTSGWSLHPPMTTGTHGVAGTITGTSDAQALTNKQLTMNNNVPIYWKTAGGVPQQTFNLLASDIFQISNPGGSIQLRGGAINLNTGIDEEIYLWGSGTGTGRELVLYSSSASALSTLQDSPTINMAATYWDGGSSAGWSGYIIHDMITAGATPKSRLKFGIKNLDILELENNNTLLSIYANGTLFPRAGTATAGTAPIKLTAGTLLTVPESGAIEYDGTGTYITNTNHRRFLSQAADSIISSVIVSNTVAETTVFTGTLNANELKAHRVYRLNYYGHLDTASAADTVTVRVHINGTTLVTLTSNSGSITDEPFHGQAVFTVRTTGVGGTISTHGDAEIGTKFIHSNIPSVSVNTTSANYITLTFQWSAAKVDNIMNLDQAFLEVLD